MKLTRYMSIGKYYDLLSTGTLFFPHYNNLGDPYEGSLGHIPTDELIKKQTKRLGRITAMPLQPQTLAREFLETFEPLLYHDFLQDFTFVNCWHQNDIESMPMWKMYAERGVMIKSDLSSLESSLGIGAGGSQHSDILQEKHGIALSNDYEVFVETGDVKYISRGNYIEPVGSDRYFRKQLEYADEKELRVILQIRLGPEQRFNFPHIFDNTNSPLQNITNMENLTPQSNFQIHSGPEENITNMENLTLQSNFQIRSGPEQIFDLPYEVNVINFSPQNITNIENSILQNWRDAKLSYEKHASILNEGLSKNGVRCPVDTNSLIKEVVVNPFNNEDSEILKIELINQRFGVEAEVKKSIIEVEPSVTEFSVRLATGETIELEL